MFDLSKPEDALTWAVRMMILVVVISIFLVARKAQTSKVLAIVVGVMAGLLVFSFTEPATMTALGAAVRSFLGFPSGAPAAG